MGVCKQQYKLGNPSGVTMVPLQFRTHPSRVLYPATASHLRWILL